MKNHLPQLWITLVASLICYMFSLHVDFINVKAQVREQDKSIEEVLKKIDVMDAKIDDIKERLFRVRK